MSRRGTERFSGNFESLQQSRIARGIEPEPPPTPPRNRYLMDFDSLRNRPLSTPADMSFFEQMTNRIDTWTSRYIRAAPPHHHAFFQNEVNNDEEVRITNGTGNFVAVSNDGLHWHASLATSRPTISQVETKLGLTKDMWDTVDPDDLIGAVYELCITGR